MVSVLCNMYDSESVIFFSNRSAFWSGLHQPFTNTSWEYQDCEVMSDDINITSFPGGKGTTFDNEYSLSEANCSTENIFICQRYQGL